MARIGLVVEGRTEEAVLKDVLRRHLESRDSRLPVDRVLGRLVPDGGDRIRNKNWVAEQVARLRRGGHDCVIVVADQERHPAAAAVRSRLSSCGADGIFVASPKFERWLLADSDAVRRSLGSPRPNNWRRGDPLEVLRALKPGYKKTTDGTLVGRVSNAAVWAGELPEFCDLLHLIESRLQLSLTACGNARRARRSGGKRTRRGPT